MRFSWLIMMAACGDIGQAPQSDYVDGQWLRSVDTGDSGMLLEAQCAVPGVCGCDYIGYDLEAPAGDDTCVHSTALVLGDIAAGAQVEAGSTVAFRASLGPGATLSAGAFLASRANVGEDAIIGVNTIIGRATTIGARTEIGDNSAIRRNATVGADVDASFGDLTMGHGSFLGDRSIVTGTNVVLGSLVSIGADSEISANVVVARGTTFGDFTTLGQGTVIGPGVSALSGVTMGENNRVRKNTTFGDDVTVGNNVRIGRDSEIRQGAQIGDNATLRSQATVGTFSVVEPNTYLRRGTVLEDQPGGFVVDQAPVVVITSPTDGANGDSGSLTLTGTVQDDFGVISVTVRIDDGAEVSIPYSNGQFTYTVTGIPDLSQTIRVTAFDASGNEGSDLLYVSDCNPSVSISHTWTGATSSDWNTASNWSTGTIPDTASKVFVCGDTPVQPQLAANTTLARLYMDWDADLASDGRTLTMTHTYSGGVTSGTGTVQANTGVRIKGTVPNFVVAGDVYMTGVTTATGNTTIGSGTRRLRVDRYALRLEGNLVQTLTGTTNGLYLRDALGRVDILGNATFGGTTTMNSSTASSPMYRGTIRVAGNLTMPCSTSSDCFVPKGTHVEMNGTSPQTLTFAGGGASGSRFASLDIQNTEGVTASGTVYASDSISVTNGGQFTATTVTTASATGINKFSGGAVVNITSVADFRGTMDVQDTSSLTINTLNSRSFFNMAPTSFYTGTTVNLYGEMVIPSDDYTPTTTHVRTVISVLDDWDHTMPLLNIPSGGRLRIDEHNFDLTGNFTQSITGTTDGLYMRDAAGDVNITGNATFGGSTTMNSSSASSPMAQGNIRIQGNLTLPCSTSSDCFVPYGTHVILNGTQPQTLTFSGGGASGSRFHSVDIKNPSGVTASGTVYASNFLSVTDGGQFTATTVTTAGAAGINEFSGGAVVNITSVGDFRGTMDVQDTSSLTINTLNSRSFFNMAPTSVYTGTTVNLYGQLVIPSDNYTPTTTHVRTVMSVLGTWDHAMPLLNIPSGGRLRIEDNDFDLTGNFTQSITGTTDGLYMRDADSNVSITGNVTFGGTTTMNSSLASSPMAQGIIRIQGNLTLPCSTSSDCFVPYGTHVILDGTQPQTLTFSGGGASGSRFHSVDIKNPSGVTASGTVYASNFLSVTDGGQFTATTVTTAGAAGINEFSGGAVVNITSVGDFRGTMDVQDTSSLTINTLNSRSFFNMAPTSVYTGTTVNLYGQLVIPSNDYTPTTTHVRTVISVLGTWNHTMPLLNIPSGGRLTIGANDFDLTGNFTQSITGTTDGLYMRDAAGNVSITGNATFGGSTTMNSSSTSSPLNAGVLQVQGNFTLPCSTSSDCFVPGGTHVILDGTAPQTLSFTGGGAAGSRFFSLDVQNDQGVTATGTVYATNSISVTGGGQFNASTVTTAGAAGLNEFSGGAVVNITSVGDFRGTIDVQDTSSLTINTLNSRSFFNMAPTSIYTGTTVNLYGQLVIPSDDYTPTTTYVRTYISVLGTWNHAMPLLNIPSGGRLTIGANDFDLDGNFTQSITGTTDGLYMRDAAGDVSITGNATFGGSTTMNSSSASSPMSQGTLQVQGNFTLPCSTSSDCFVPYGTHVILNGSTPQTLTFAGGGASGSRFHSVDFANTSGTTTSGSLYASSDITISGTHTHPSGTATTNANLTIDGGVLNNNGTFRYNNVFTTPNGGTVVGNAPVNF